MRSSEELYQGLLPKAIRFYSIRPRSVSEFKTFLAKKLAKNVDQKIQVTDMVLARLEELGYVDDIAFANWLSYQRTRVTPRGEIAIKRELLQKGVAEDIIQDVLVSHRVHANDAAKRLVSSKAHLWKSLSGVALNKKLYELLARRGFTNNTIQIVIDEILGKDYNT